jgi:hypothetical protein
MEAQVPLAENQEIQMWKDGRLQQVNTFFLLVTIFTIDYRGSVDLRSRKTLFNLSTQSRRYTVPSRCIFHWHVSLLPSCLLLLMYSNIIY